MGNSEIVISSKGYIDNNVIDKRRGKTDVDEIIINLLDEVGEIEASDKTQSAKTMAITRAAKKVITALYGKRKQKGPNAVSLDSAAKALTKVRNAITATGAKHHSFDKSINSLRNKYPHCAYMVNEIDGYLVKETRERWNKLREKIRQVTRLEKELKAVSPDLKNYASVINHIAENFPSWEREILALKTLKTGERAAALEKLHSILEETREFYPALDQLKIDHEVMRHLRKDAFSTDNKSAESHASLIEKKEGTIQVDYPRMMQVLELLLGKSASHRWEALATAVALATGRRAIEVLAQGEFEKIDKHRLKFIGQAKKREGITGDEMEIYCLVDADIVIEALKRLRSFSNIAKLENLTAERHYKKNELINNRTAGPLNTFVRDLLEQFPITPERRMSEWVFKDTRALYAKTVFELFFKEDKRWAKKDENMFFQELLGHHDSKAQKHYMQFKIQNAGAKWEPMEVNSEKRRLDAMKAMRDNEWISARSTRLSLHDAVIQMIEDDPWRTFKPVDLRKDDKGGTRNYAMVKQYLEVVSDALKVDWSLDAILEGKAKQVEEQTEPKPTKKETKPTKEAEQEIHDEPTETKEVKSEDKPKFSPPKRLDNGYWLVNMNYRGMDFDFTVSADNPMLAMHAAWAEYEFCSSLPKKPMINTMKKDGWWIAQIKHRGTVVLEHMGPGKKTEYVNALLVDYNKRFAKYWQ
ncbi:TPA: hypothetical protein JG860_004320 [Vibrio parahaemolyticus]|nr:hypothetical protein [Vibrio parahaemolyticus]